MTIGVGCKNAVAVLVVGEENGLICCINDVGNSSDCIVEKLCNLAIGICRRGYAAKRVVGGQVGGSRNINRGNFAIERVKKVRDVVACRVNYACLVALRVVCEPNDLSERVGDANQISDVVVSVSD